MSNALAPRQKDLMKRLNESLSKGSLDDLVRATRRENSMLLIDVSGSMGDRMEKGHRKIDALREVVATLRETHPVPMAAFGLSGAETVKFVERIPDPDGMTPLDEGIDFSKRARATHIVVITDGHPDDRESALAAARRFAGRIDVFYIGDDHDSGAEFCRELASVSGGAVNVTDLSKPRELASKIAGFLPSKGGAR